MVCGDGALEIVFTDIRNGKVYIGPLIFGIADYHPDSALMIVGPPTLDPLDPSPDRLRKYYLWCGNALVPAETSLAALPTSAQGAVTQKTTGEAAWQTYVNDLVESVGTTSSEGQQASRFEIALTPTDAATFEARLPHRAAKQPACSVGVEDSTLTVTNAITAGTMGAASKHPRATQISVTQ